MTADEKQRKNDARRLINMPVAERPNNVHYKPASTLNLARYMVELDGVGVYFQHDGQRLYYLGEYPIENWR